MLMHPSTERDRMLVARAIQATRVSIFTLEERVRLRELVTILTGYELKEDVYVSRKLRQRTA